MHEFQRLLLNATKGITKWSEIKKPMLATFLINELFLALQMLLAWLILSQFKSIVVVHLMDTHWTSERVFSEQDYYMHAIEACISLYVVCNKTSCLVWSLTTNVYWMQCIFQYTYCMFWIDIFRRWTFYSISYIMSWSCSWIVLEISRTCSCSAYIVEYNYKLSWRSQDIFCSGDLQDKYVLLFNY